MVATSQFTISVINDGQDGTPGGTGPQGVSVRKVVTEYRLSNSSSEMTGSGAGYTWSETKPEVPAGKFLWIRERTDLSNNTSSYSDAHCDIVISNLVFDVDQNTQVITSKIWETYTSTAISNYDTNTTKLIRDDVSDLKQDLEGIETRVGTAESTLTTKADGSTVQTLSNNFSTFQQTMNGFKTTVEQNYATKTELGNIKVSGNNLYLIKNQVPGYINSSSGAISNPSSTYKEKTSEYIPVTPGKTYIIQAWATPTQTGQSWLAYQFYADQDASSKIGSRAAKTGSASGSGVETTAEGQERLTYKVDAPETANYLRVSYRQYTDGCCMVEQATLPSEYAIATADLENETSSVRTIAEQTADKFSWIVEDGSTSSSVTYTANALSAMAEQIDLTGKVTFNSFDTETQNALTSGSELINGTQTASTSAWTGKSTKLKSLASGTRISYKLPYASTSTAVTLNLTLNNNTTTGAKNVYYLNDTRLTTQYGANSIVELIYDGSAWRVINPYSDQNTYDRTRYQQPIKAGSVAIAAGNIIVAGANNVGTYTHLKRGQAFDTTYPILYAGSAISANSTGTDNYLIVPMGISTTQSGSYTAYKAVYIKGTLSGTTFTPISTTPLTQTIPTSADNYHYILLGTMYSTTEMYLLGEHPIFAYYNGGFKTVAQIAAEAATSASSAVTTAGQANDNASAALTAVNSSIKSTTMHYLATSASSGITTSTSGWDTSPQSITATNRYLWTYQTITKVDNTTYDTDPVISGVWGNTGSQGSQGEQGVSVTKVEQLYRTSSSTTAPTAPSSVITSTSTSYNTWTLAMPTYNTSYPYYYTCTQTTYSNGNHTWTTVARSQAIEDANKTANTANTNASNAVTTANTASENATAAVGTANEANSTANTALNGIKAFVGTSSTAAGTAAKVVDCSDDTFAMTNGVIITVTFSNASTADAPTLNVKSLGAKAIYFDNAVTSSSNRFRWKAGSVITFQYNGTYWVVLNYENLGYFTSSTAAGTAAKANASITGTFALCRGTTINVYFSTANTANAPTLNVSATGAFPIYYKNAVTSASNKYLWDAGTTLTFTFNGSYWHINDGRAGTAVDWISTNGSTVITASDIMKTWTGDATLATTTIDGGYIKTHTIESEHLATDAIMSNNYEANTSSVYSTTGTFLDLANGNITSPTFAVDNTNGMAYIDGAINARYLSLGMSSAELASSGGILASSNGDIAAIAPVLGNYIHYDGETLMINTENFHIGSDGSVSMSGSINSTSGFIGGWEISENDIHYGMNIGQPGTAYLIPAGSATAHQVGGSPTISGWTITSGDSFGVTNTGALYASNANVSGTISASYGSIGSWMISPDYLSYGTIGQSNSAFLVPNGTLSAYTIGGSPAISGWVLTAGENFGVTNTGALYASNANITGEINATTGSIGGWNISSSAIRKDYTYDGKTGYTTIYSIPYTAGNTVPWNPMFGVYYDGAWRFYVRSNGELYSSNIRATAGTLGSWNLTSNAIMATGNSKTTGMQIPSHGTWSFAVGATDPNNWATAPFRVKHNGEMYSTSGQIGGFNITANSISGGNITISSNEITAGAIMSIQNSSTSAQFYANGISIYDLSSSSLRTFISNSGVHHQDTSGHYSTMIAGFDSGIECSNSSGNVYRFMLNDNNNGGVYNVTNSKWGFVHNYNSDMAALYAQTCGVRIGAGNTSGTKTFMPRAADGGKSDGVVYCGASDCRWNTVYSKNGTSTSSDERLKKIYRHLGDDHKKLFMELKPIEYSFIDDLDKKHFGLGAQTTEVSMDRLGFGSEYNIVEHSFYSEADTYGRHDTYNMNYIEALMLAVPVVQEHEKEIAKLKARINELEAKLSQLTS